MKFFKNLFKSNYKSIKITKDLFENKRICSWGEFFEASGVLKWTDEMQKAAKEQTYHIDNVRVHPETLALLEAKLKENLFSKKNKYARIYRDKKLQSMHAFDNLMWAPKTDKKIAKQTVVIYLPGDKHFKYAKGA